MKRSIHTQRPGTWTLVGGSAIAGQAAASPRAAVAAASQTISPTANCTIARGREQGMTFLQCRVEGGQIRDISADPAGGRSRWAFWAHRTAAGNHPSTNVWATAGHEAARGDRAGPGTLSGGPRIYPDVPIARLVSLDVMNGREARGGEGKLQARAEWPGAPEPPRRGAEAVLGTVRATLWAGGR